MPDELIAAATTKQWGIGVPGRGYGYQWWTNDDGSLVAQGIFGQGIFIDPKRKLVIASNGNWPTATDPEGVGAAREAFYKRVQAAVDKGAAKGRGRTYRTFFLLARASTTSKSVSATLACRAAS